MVVMIIPLFYTIDYAPIIIIIFPVMNISFPALP